MESAGSGKGNDRAFEATTLGHVLGPGGVRSSMREEEWLELLKSIAIGDQLALLHGELCVDDKKFHSGDFIRAEAGSVDLRVWTETGCTCVVMTSLKDTIL